MFFLGTIIAFVKFQPFYPLKMWSGSVLWQGCAPRASTTVASSLFLAFTHLLVGLALLPSLANPQSLLSSPPTPSVLHSLRSFCDLMFSVFRVLGEFRNLLISTQCSPSPHYSLLLMPTSIARVAFSVSHSTPAHHAGTVQSDCFGSLRVLPQDLLFALTLDVMSVFVLVAFYWFLVRFSDSCACLLIRLSFNRVIPLFPFMLLPHCQIKSL